MRSTTGPAAVAAPWVWTAGEITAQGAWTVTLGAAARDEMASALDQVKRRRLALEDITASDFPLPSMAAAFATIRRLLGEGPGLCLVRGIPVERHARDDLARILWGLGTHIGRGVAQSYRGDMIGEVMDMSHTGDTRRSYRSPRALALHCDPVDVVGLLCLRRAKTGGTSLLASSLAVHNAILAERPDLLPALYRGYHYRHSEAGSLGGAPTTPHRIPVFGACGDRVVCNFNAAPIARSLAEDGLEDDAQALEAFEHFKATARREDLVYETMLEPGDLQLLNNRTVLHGRTPFEDYEGLDRKRLMLRLWLAIPGWAPLPENMRLHARDRAEPRPRTGAPPQTA